MNYAAVPAAEPQVPTVFCIGTLDTKGPDLAYVVQEFSRNLSLFGPPAAGEKKVQVVAVDVSASSATDIAFEHPHITRGEVLSHHPDVYFRSTTALPSDRGAAVAVLTTALQQFLDEWQSKGLLVGALGIGGSGGTALIAPALRHLPIGLPKLLVSTVASSKSANYAEASDLVLWPSVVDIAGLNRVSKIILSNAAAAMAGMVAASAKRRDARKRERADEATKPTVGLTMFGVTTPCVTVVQRKLEEAGFEPLLFHATGIGGQAMENMVAQGLVQGVIDITTTEVADHIVGGVMPCKSNRFVAMIEKRIPLVVSVGALDMVNFWEETSIPTSFTSCNRKFYVHNEKVTLMRTTPEENRMFARFIANALNKSTAPVTILLPEHGVSALDAQGKPFDDPKARQALYDELEVMFHQTPTHQIQRRPFHINDIAFAEALVEEFVAIASDLLLGARKDYETSVELPLGAVPSPSLSREVEHTHGVDKNRLGLSLSWLGLEAPLRWRTPATEEAHLYRSQILQRLWAQISRGIPIIGAGAGTGISAKFEEEGGADLIIVYNSGRFRMAGRGSLAGLMPYKDANAVLVEMASEILPVVRSVPVLAGVCASDPFRQMHRFLPQLAEMGFAGVQNFPTVGLIDGNFRQNLEETGMGYGLEVDMIQEAHRLGLLTTPYAFTETEAQQMARAGADIIVAHMGLTTSGSIGAQTALSLETCAHRVQNIAVAAHEIRQDIIVLCHGGPITGPNEANYVLQNSGVHGFYGASSMERLPVEIAVTSTMREYKEIKLPQGVSL